MFQIKFGDNLSEIVKKLNNFKYVCDMLIQVRTSGMSCTNVLIQLIFLFFCLFLTGSRYKKSYGDNFSVWELHERRKCSTWTGLNLFINKI